LSKEDAVFSDELNHASIIDGCRLSGARIVRYKHNEAADLRPLPRWEQSAELLRHVAANPGAAPPLGRDYPKFKLFGWNGELKHVVEPFIAFNETSRFGKAGKLPRFDELDARPGVDGSASGEQSIELGLKQHFLARSLPGKPFLDLIRWRIGTRYHFRPVLLSDGRYQKGWSSVESDLDIEPDEAFRISFRRTADLVDGGSPPSGPGTQAHRAGRTCASLKISMPPPVRS